jgi:energy-coupling factor transporter transmembrane protein EcfT
MKLNVFGSIFVFLITSYPGLIISILIFCISIVLLIIKRKTLKNMVKVIFLILAIISAFLIGISIYFSIAFGRNSSMGIIGGADGPTAIYITGKNDNNVLELFDNDYEIIKYDEHKLDSDKNIMQMNFSLRIINMDKLSELENDIISIIYVHINNKRYLARGQLSILSTFPEKCDCMFPINNNGKVEFFENKIISFLGFRDNDE